ncbi:MAG: hypothetical protein FJX31_10090 [Alphaproteobacteria bacterium]|nr:hypothetical protein [Alphaproteobacteria bacterium]
MLLTLIVILTGLSWQGGSISPRAVLAPAQVSAGSALATVQQAKASAVLARPAGAGFAVREMVTSQPVRVASAEPASGVLIRVDRSRE